VLVNAGDGRFRKQLDYGTGYPRALAIDDLNGDRRLDLMVMNGSTVSVLLNKPGRCNVQDLRRQTLKAAKQTLARVNCRVGKVSYAYSRTIRGLVIRQKPKLGAVLRGGSAVDVVVSRGGKPS
jgi:beta-lactam-binding protein with PASTA domain